MRDAHLYADLAAIGQAHGYPVTASVVHLWTHRGLLPASVDRRPGFGQRETALHPEAEHRLLAICRYRFDERVTRLEWIGALMWLDGEPVVVGFMRDALRREIGRRPLRPLPRPGDGVDRMARQFARRTEFVQAMPDATPGQRADTSFAIVGGSLGDDEVSPDGIDEMAAVTGTAADQISSMLDALRSGIGDPASIIESSDGDYEKARQAWLSGWIPAMPCRSKKSRVRMKKVLFEFLACLRTVQLVGLPPSGFPS